ncbi:MAG: hypothetical protein E5W60_22080, partial [Mesorhizobium sp.]
MTQSTTKSQTEPAAHDPYLWLEDRSSKEALDWVHAQ